jgi:hypothetical protein
MTQDTQQPVHEDRVWRDELWTARVIKNEDDDGWAVATFLDDQAELNKNVNVTVDGRRIHIELAIVPNEVGATASLRAVDEFDEELARVAVPPGFKLNASSAETWVLAGFEKPR